MAENIKDTTSKSGLGKPLNYESQPTRMNRTPGKGPKGNNFSLTNTAEFGLGLGQAPTKMSRSGGTGAKGNTFNLWHTGPTRMPRSDKGSASHDATDFGIGGVSGNGGTGYGVGGK